MATKKAVKENKQPIYEVQEFAKNSMRLFQVPPECVHAAFQVAGCSGATLEEAKVIITKFLTGGK